MIYRIISYHIYSPELGRWKHVKSFKRLCTPLPHAEPVLIINITHNNNNNNNNHNTNNNNTSTNNNNNKYTYTSNISNIV